jgi:hypothetical protein
VLRLLWRSNLGAESEPLATFTARTHRPRIREAGQRAEEDADALFVVVILNVKLV